MKQVTLNRETIVSGILIMEDNTVKVSTTVRYMEKTGSKKRVAEKIDYHILRPATQDSPADDITNEDQKVKDIISVIW